MKRRSFLNSSLAIGAGLAVLPSRSWSQTKKNGTLQLAQIGCGRMGLGDMQNAMNLGMKEDLNARIIACCDVDADRATAGAVKAKHFYQDKGESKVEIKTCTDYRELLQRKDIDGFICSTPENWHALIGIAGAEAGKHMYIQKPLTYSIPEGQALVKAVRKNGVVLQVGSQQRSDIRFRQVCTIIRNNWLGKLTKIEVQVPTDRGEAHGEPSKPPANLNYDMWLGPCPEMPYIEERVHPQEGYDRPGWLQVERFCLGMITGWGSHMYDIAQWANGTDTDSGPVEIQAEGEFPDRGLFNVHVGYEGDARYANGVEMSSRNGKAGVKFITEDGWAYCSRGKMECSDKTLLRRQPGEDEVQLYTSQNHMGDFLRSAREGSDPVCPVEVGHRSNTVCVLHHVSMKLGGRKLNWDPVKEIVVDDDEANALIQVSMREPYAL